jgi:FkbM family methyltransferase
MSILSSVLVRRLISNLSRGGPRLTKMLTQKFPEKRVFELTKPLQGVQMQFDTSDIFEAQMAFGTYQPRLLTEIKRLSRPGDQVIMAGAALGYVPLALANLGCKVIAMEADPRNYEKCRDNIALNKNLEVVLFGEGLSDVNATELIWLSDVGTHSSFAAQHHATTQGEAKVRRGDDVLQELRVSEIDGIVLDVEGWEIHALEGLRETFTKKLPRWAIIECADWALQAAGKSEAELRELIGSFGWKVTEEIGSDLVCVS